VITRNVSSWTVHTVMTSKGPSRRPNPHYSNPAEGGKLSRSGLHVRLVKAGEGNSFSPTHVILPLPLNTISHFMVMDVAFFLAIFQFPEVKSISLYGLWLWKVKSVYKLNSTICIKKRELHFQNCVSRDQIQLKFEYFTHSARADDRFLCYFKVPFTIWGAWLDISRINNRFHNFGTRLHGCFLETHLPWHKHMPPFGTQIFFPVSCVFLWQ